MNLEMLTRSAVTTVRKTEKAVAVSSKGLKATTNVRAGVYRSQY